MARITSIKELQTICDDLYTYFAERLAQVTDIDKVCREYCTDVYLYTDKTIKCSNLHIIKSNNGVISFWANGNNGLSVGRLFDHNSIEIVRTTETINDRGFRVLEEKRYTNKNGQKTADLKKRAILEDLQSKLEILFKDSVLNFINQYGNYDALGISMLGILISNKPLDFVPDYDKDMLLRTL